jgi:alpha-acetolactate decarboxylase
MTIHRLKWNRVAIACAVCGVAALSGFAKEGADGALVQFGTMREAIGQQQHQGRVALSTLVNQPHFFGVAALEKLEGEITVFDSDVTVTGVTAEGTLAAVSAKDAQATLLVGAYVADWTERTVDEDTPAAGFDDLIRDAARHSNIDVAEPFIFTIEGAFSDVRMHVINGACPMHARLKNIELPKEQAPFEGEFKSVRGRVVGVYASDAVGKLTHPATATHVHLIFRDDASGQTATGHVEQIGLAKGAVLKLPRRD